jgi:hypothetical protein
MSKKQRFWKLENPYWAVIKPIDDGCVQWVLKNYHNGYQKPLYSIPYIECPQCGECWALAGILPFQCPQSLVGNPLLDYGHGPLPVQQHQQLIRKIEAALSKEGIYYTEEIMNDYHWLAPGTDFADREFQIGYPPTFHFHWAEMGHRPTVKREVKEVLESNHVTGVTFHEVDITFVGKGEPEEIPFFHTFPGYADATDVRTCFEALGKLNENDYDIEPTEIEPRDNPKSYGPLYHMRVSHWGPGWKDWAKPPDCTLCGYREQPEKPENIVFEKKHILDGYDIFRSAVASSIIVSEKVHDIIMDHKFTNCHLTELPLSNG